MNFIDSLLSPLGQPWIPNLSFDKQPRYKPNNNLSLHKSPRKSSRNHYKNKISKINKIFSEVAPELSRPHNVNCEDNMYDYVLQTLEYIV